MRCVIHIDIDCFQNESRSFPGGVAYGGGHAARDARRTERGALCSGGARARARAVCGSREGGWRRVMREETHSLVQLILGQGVKTVICGVCGDDRRAVCVRMR